MEKLPWFKFNPSNWIMGKIQRCSEITQARFLRLCCIYWNNECEMLFEDAEIEIDREHLDLLIDKKVVKFDGRTISIDFLDEQYLTYSIETKNKRQAGVIGNLKRWHKDVYDRYSKGDISIDEALKLIATLSQTDNTPIADQSQNIAEKRREEEIREEDISNSLPIASTVIKAQETFNWEQLLKFFNETFGKKSKVINDAVKKKYLARLKDGYEKTDIHQAMINASKDSYHIETNFKHCTLEFFSRPDKIDKFASMTKNPFEVQPPAKKMAMVFGVLTDITEMDPLYINVNKQLGNIVDV